MRLRLPILMIVASLATCGIAYAGDQAPAKPATNYWLEPLLVKVDSQGKVVSMSPAYRLEPSMEKVLRATVEGMIKKPATDQSGHPIPSQFVMNMMIQMQPGTNGSSNVQFTVASIKSVPGSGNWIWSRGSDHRMTLVNRSGLMTAPTANDISPSASYTGGGFIGSAPSAPPSTGRH